MKLKARTTYINNGGRTVHIAGLTGEKHGKQPLYWSIQGDHYAEDGRFVSWSRRDPWAVKLESMGLHRILLPADARSSIKEEVTTEAAKRWWDGVVTETLARGSYASYGKEGK